MKGLALDAKTMRPATLESRSGHGARACGTGSQNCHRAATTMSSAWRLKGIHSVPFADGAKQEDLVE